MERKKEVSEMIESEGLNLDHEPHFGVIKVKARRQGYMDELCTLEEADAIRIHVLEYWYHMKADELYKISKKLLRDMIILCAHHGRKHAIALLRKSVGVFIDGYDSEDKGPLIRCDMVAIKQAVTKNEDLLLKVLRFYNGDRVARIVIRKRYDKEVLLGWINKNIR